MADPGYHIEPYGVDLAPGLAALARERLPQWAGRIALGDSDLTVAAVPPPYARG